MSKRIIERNERGLTINLGRAFGINFRVMSGADERRYLCTVTWYPRQRFTRLGYLYGSLRLPG